MASHVALWNVM